MGKKVVKLQTSKKQIPRNHSELVMAYKEIIGAPLLYNKNSFRGDIQYVEKVAEELSYLGEKINEPEMREMSKRLYKQVGMKEEKDLSQDRREEGGLARKVAVGAGILGFAGALVFLSSGSSVTGDAIFGMEKVTSQWIGVGFFVLMMIAIYYFSVRSCGKKKICEED